MQLRLSSVAVNSVWKMECIYYDMYADHRTIWLVNVQLILFSNPAATSKVKRDTETDSPICQCSNN